MASFVVSVLGVGAVALAIWLIARGWESERVAPPVFVDGASVGVRATEIIRRTSAMLTAAVVAALLIPGLGGRLMMRVLAATSGDRAQGRITDADEVVGEITAGGSIGLVVFIGIFGGFMSLGLFVILRRWMPRRSVSAGMVAAGIGAGLFARPTGLIDPENRDFRILSPVWLAVACGIALIVVFGLLLMVLVDDWSARWPAPARSGAGLLATAPGALLLVAAVVAAIPGAVIILAVLVGIYLRPRFGLSGLERAEPIGRIITGVAAIAGFAWVAVTSIEVLRL